MQEVSLSPYYAVTDSSNHIIISIVSDIKNFAIPVGVGSTVLSTHHIVGGKVVLKVTNNNCVFNLLVLSARLHFYFWYQM